MEIAPVTVVLLTFNEEATIGRALASVAANTVRPAAVLVIDNGSTDRTQMVVEACAAQYPERNIRWLRAGANNIGASRAWGARLATTEFVAFLDADCEAPANWLADLLAGFRRQLALDATTAAVGGPALPPVRERAFYRWLACMTSIFPGHLDSPQARPVKHDTAVEHLPAMNLLIQRERLLAAGNFSADFPLVCEDVELGVRLRSRGARLVMLREPRVQHFLTPTFVAWTDRIFRFGHGQWLVARHFPSHIGLRLLAPLLFLLFFTLALVSAPAYPVLLMIPCVYFGAVLVCAYYVTRKQPEDKRLSESAAVSLLFVLTHFAYALGECYGMVRYFGGFVLSARQK